LHHFTLVGFKNIALAGKLVQNTITGSIIGVGLTKRISAVRWGVTVRLLWAWILTIPVSAVLAAFVWWVCGLFGL